MGDKPKGDIHAGSPTPWGVLMESIRAVPAVKYALEIARIVSAIAIVVELKVSFRSQWLARSSCSSHGRAFGFRSPLGRFESQYRSSGRLLPLVFTLPIRRHRRNDVLVGLFSLAIRSKIMAGWVAGSRTQMGIPTRRKRRARLRGPKNKGRKQLSGLPSGAISACQFNGCESQGQKIFGQTAPGELDPSKGSYRGFDLEVTGNNGHGVRNVSPDGNTISFEAYAEAPGTREGVLRCVGAQGANVNVNVYAYVI